MTAPEMRDVPVPAYVLALALPLLKRRAEGLASAQKIGFAAEPEWIAERKQQMAVDAAAVLRAIDDIEIACDAAGLELVPESEADTTEETN